MNELPSIFFVWVPGVKGPSCEILYGLDQNIDSHGKDRKELLEKYELPLEHRDLSLNQLSIIYPYGGVEAQKSTVDKKEIE